MAARSANRIRGDDLVVAKWAPGPIVRQQNSPSRALYFFAVRRLRRDIREARRRTTAQRPIPTIDDNFSEAGGMHQGATGFATLAEFFRNLRRVRRHQ
jgi:hypothetical protein